MIFPNKFCPMQSSALNKSIFILEELIKSDNYVLDLYEKVKKHFYNIIEFQEALDLLYMLKKIELKGETLCYIK